jgi:hypothetical protein
MLRKVEHLPHPLRIHSLDQDSSSGSLAVRDHHGIDDERSYPDHPRYGVKAVHDPSILTEVAGVLEHEHVRIHTEHLVSELLPETTSHAHDGCQSSHAQRDSKHRERRSDGNERPLLGAHVPEREVERETHRPRCSRVQANDQTDRGT